MIGKYKNGVQQPVPVELDPTQLALLQLANGEYNATPPTLTDGDKDALQLDKNGDLKTTLENINYTLSHLLRAIQRPITLDNTTGKTRAIISTDSLFSMYFAYYWSPPSGTGSYSIAQTSGFDWNRTAWNQNVRTRIA